jgi:hypothetical protein
MVSARQGRIRISPQKKPGGTITSVQRLPLAKVEPIRTAFAGARHFQWWLLRSPKPPVPETPETGCKKEAPGVMSGVLCLENLLRQVSFGDRASVGQFQFGSFGGSPCTAAKALLDPLRRRSGLLYIFRALAACSHFHDSARRSSCSKQTTYRSQRCATRLQAYWEGLRSAAASPRARSQRPDIADCWRQLRTQWWW